nr:unnamed protein product [Callosobruchus analis]
MRLAVAYVHTCRFCSPSLPPHHLACQ